MRYAFFTTLVTASLSMSAFAHAQSSNDGIWAVTLNTQKGDCDRSLSSSIQVRDGRVDEQGLFVRVSGGIDASGKVTIQVAHGSDNIAAYGTVMGQQAHGSWTSPTRNCGGSWTATH
jgi:hypothetical protein